MRVLGVFSTDQLLGGGEVSFSLSLKGLQDAGCEVLALLPGAGPLSEHLTSVGIRHQIAPQETLRRGGSVQFLLRPHPDWLEIARQFQPDVMHCNAIRSALYGQAIGRARSVPVVFHARTAQKDPPFDQFLIATTSAIVCTSEVVNARFPSWFGSDRRIVIPNPINPEFFAFGTGREGRLREEWLQGSAGPLIGIVGRLSPAKGQNRIIEAAPAILREFPSCRFVLIGGADPSHPGYARELKSKLISPSCDAAFVFAGFQDDMRSAYRALDVVAFPTLSEGFGRIVIEAGALSKPIVATDLPVLREIIPSPLRDRCLAEPIDFASKLIRLMRDKALRYETGRELHDHVAANYGLDRHVERLMELYSRLCLKKGD